VDSRRFDAFAAALAERCSRRAAGRFAAGGALGGLVALAGNRAPDVAAKPKRGNAGDACRQRRQCVHPLICDKRRCCVKTGGDCIADADCCSGACDGDSGQCLCPVTLDQPCGGRCCNALTETCANDRCCKTDGISCRRDSDCCSGTCADGTCGGGCTGTDAHFCPPTPDHPQGFCCSNPPTCARFVGCVGQEYPGGPTFDACNYILEPCATPRQRKEAP
jgi:hypothetical protein